MKMQLRARAHSSIGAAAAPPHRRRCGVRHGCRLFNLSARHRHGLLLLSKLYMPESMVPAPPLLLFLFLIGSPARAAQRLPSPCPHHGHGSYQQTRPPASCCFSPTYAALSASSHFFHVLHFFLRRLLFCRLLIPDFHQQECAQQICLPSFYDLVAVRRRIRLYKNSWLCGAILPGNSKSYWHLRVYLLQRNFHQNSRSWICLCHNVRASHVRSPRLNLI